MSKKISKSLFILLSALVIVFGTVAGISSLWLFMPIGSRFTEHTDYLVYLYTFPIFEILSMIRFILFKKEVRLKSEITASVLASLTSVFIVFTPFVYEFFDNITVNKVIIPIVCLIGIICLAFNMILVCIDIKKSAKEEKKKLK